jgi:hypothetical protein
MSTDSDQLSSEDLAKMVAEIDQNKLDEFEESLIKSELITPDKIYIDLGFLKELTIGTLLSLVLERSKNDKNYDAEQSYVYIQSMLPEYDKRQFHDIEHCFPELNISNVEFKKRMYDPFYSNEIFNLAPISKFMDVLKAQIRVNINHSRVIQKRNPISVVVNTYPLHISKTNKDIVGLFLSNLFSINVSVIYYDLRKVTPSDFTIYDELYILYPDLLLSAVRDELTALKYLTKFVFVPKLFGNEFSHTKNILKEETHTRNVLNTLTNFKYVDLIHLSPRVTEVSSTEQESES